MWRSLLLALLLEVGALDPDPMDALKQGLEAGRYAEAEEGARRLLGQVEGAKGAGSLEATEVLHVLVEALWRGGKAAAPATRELAERAVATREGTLGADHPKTVESLRDLAIVVTESADYAGAKPLLERILEISERTSGPEHPEVAKSLGNLAVLLKKMGDYSGARPLLERCLHILEGHFGPEHKNVVPALNNLGNLLAGLGEHAAARSLHERALAIQEKTFGPEHPSVAASLTGLGILLESSGDYSGAKERYAQALGIRERALGPDHPDVAKSLNNLANAVKALGEYDEARLAYERSLAIRERRLGPDHIDLAAPLNNLANLLRAMGDETGAEVLYERCLALREKHLGPEHPDLADTVSNLGLLRRDTHDYADAKHLLERALAIKTKAWGPDHPRLATTLKGLADVQRETGELEEAVRLYGRALALQETALGGDHPAVANTLVGLAAVRAASGDAAEARRLSERALDIRERHLGPDHPDVAEALTLLAELSFSAREDDEALRRASRAAGILNRHVRDTVAVLPERQALRLVATRVRPESVIFAGLLTARGNRAAWVSAGWDWALGRHAVVLEELAARHRGALQGTPEARKAWTRLGAARKHLAGLWVEGPDEKHPQRFRSLLEKARQGKEAAELAFAGVNAQFRRERTARSVTLQDVARALPAHSGLVEVVRVQIGARGATNPELRDVALLLAPGGAPSFADLGPASSSDALVRDWRAAVADAYGSAATTVEEDPAAMGRLERAGVRLRKAIWDPIARRVATARTVFLVPEGAIHQVAFAALPAEGGGFLIEKAPTIHLLGSSRDLVRLGAGEHDDSAAHARGILAVGAPDFDASAELRLAHSGRAAAAETYRGGLSRCGHLAESRWPALPESAREALRIAELFEAREPVLTLVGAEASEERFKREAPGRRILHLATHGFFLQGEGQCSTDNPLLLSGLVLAGANRAAEATKETEDGVLTAEELAALDLRSVRIAVLSACDTGRGELERGEGIFGLRRALELAGVRSVVMSLWPVPDRQARRWMERFYQEIAGGNSTGEATRRASLHLLGELRRDERPPHPYLWAGFVAAGDWRE